MSINYTVKISAPYGYIALSPIRKTFHNLHDKFPHLCSLVRSTPVQTMLFRSNFTNHTRHIQIMYLFSSHHLLSLKNHLHKRAFQNYYLLKVTRQYLMYGWLIITFLKVQI